MAMFNKTDPGKGPKYRIRATMGGVFEVQRWTKKKPEWETVGQYDNEKQAVASARDSIAYDKKNATSHIIKVKKGHGNQPFIKRKKK